MSIRAAGKQYGIPEATIRHKLLGFRSMTSKPGPKTLLTDAEEQVLVNYVVHACKRAHPVTKANVMQAVTCIIQEESQQGIIRKKPPSSTGNAPKQKWWTLEKDTQH